MRHIRADIGLMDLTRNREAPRAFQGACQGPWRHRQSPWLSASRAHTCTQGQFPICLMPEREIVNPLPPVTVQVTPLRVDRHSNGSAPVADP